MAPHMPLRCADHLGKLHECPVCVAAISHVALYDRPELQLPTTTRIILVRGEGLKYKEF